MSAADSSAHARARELVLKYGFNATSYQILNPGFLLWFSSRTDAVVGYAEHHGVRVVAGVPVCRNEEVPSVIAEFESDAHTNGLEVTFFATERRTLPFFLHSDARIPVVIGAQPVWHPAELMSAMQS